MNLSRNERKSCGPIIHSLESLGNVEYATSDCEGAGAGGPFQDGLD